MKTLRNFTKAFAVHAVIFSLLQTSFVFSAQAASYDTIEQTGKEAVNVLGAAVNMYGQVKTQQIMQQQQLAQQVQNAKLLQQLSPGCRKADGTLCYASVGKLFPECPLPASMATMPQNVCSETKPTPQESAAQISSMDNYENIANNWVNHYDQMLNVASNAATPSGLKCLEDKQKAVNSQLTEMVNNLTRLQDQLNKDKETFRANNKKILEEIALANDELLGSGGTGKNNLKLKTADFSKYFSSSCQSVIESSAVSFKDGLAGVMQSLSPINKKASDFNTNKNALESEVRSDIAKFQAAIKSGGLQDFIKGNVATTSKFGALNTAIVNQVKEFNIAKERITKELGKLNYEVPAMDKDFTADFNDEIGGASSMFQTRYVNSCTMGTSSAGIAIPLNQLLDKMVQQNGTAGARDQYKAAIINAMNSGDSMERVVMTLQGLEDSTYKGMMVTYQTPEGQNITSSPASILTETWKKCEAAYTTNEKKKTVRAQNLMKELKTLHDTYSSNLGVKGLEQVLSCNGETKKSGSNCGSGESFNHTSPSFCISHAQQCASEVNGCFAEANKHVETRKTKMESLAKVFNANATAMVARSNQLYNVQKTAVMDMIKLYQTRFPGTNFEIPENMFVSMPELKTDSFGIPLAGDGNMAFMDELPKKIDLMKKMFKSQQENVNNEIQDYIAKQSDAMEKQKDRWKQLAQQCRSMADSIRKDVNKFTADGMKGQQQLDNKVGLFCKKYSDLKSNPLSACNNDPQKLAEDADAIAGRLTPNAQYITVQFRNVCNQYNNESSSAFDSCLDVDMNETSSAGKKKRDACKQVFAKEERRLASLDTSGPKPRSSRLSAESFCKDDTVTDEQFIAAAAAKLSEGDKTTLKDVKTLTDLKDKYSKLDETSEDFLKGMVSLADKDQSICKAVTEAEKADLEEYPTREKVNEHFKKLEEAIKAEAKIPAVAAAGDKPAVAASTSPDLATKLKENAAEKAKAMKKIKLNEAIASLSPVLSKDDAKISQLSRIGQQTDQSCDAQNSAQQNIVKSFSDSLIDFDRARLGQQASQK